MKTPSRQSGSSSRGRSFWFGILGLVSFLILLVAAFIAYQSILRLYKASEWVSHSREVLASAESLRESIAKAESNVRGWLLTDEHEYLDSYHSDTEAIARGRSELSRLTIDNPQQQVRIEQLELEIDDQLKLMSILVDLPQALRKESFSRDRLLTRATDQMRLIRHSIGTIRRAEYDLLDDRRKTANSAFQIAAATSLLTTGIAVGLLLTSFFLNRRAARMAVETSRLARYNQRLLDSTAEGIYGLNANGICTFMNHSGALVLGGRPVDFQGKNMHDLVHHSHVDESNYPLNDCPIFMSIQKSEGCRMPNEVFWRLDGKPVPVEYSSFPLFHGNVTEGAVVTFSDITQRKRAADDLLNAKDAAEQANEAKSQFLANMSHELRTPLNAVIMYSELLEDECKDRKIDDFIPDLIRIRRAGKHLLELVNSLLDLSKIEAGKMEIFLESFDVAELVHDVASTVEPLVEKHSNELAVETSSDLTTMHGDVTKIRQVLFNLLSNACKFTENGKVRMSVSRDNAKNQVIFEVSDTGIGMSGEQIDRLFKPFMQADSSTTRKFGGTGLGLAIIKRFTDLMGGTVDVRSSEGKGTTFTVALPVKPDDVVVSSEQLDVTEVSSKTKTPKTSSDVPDSVTATSSETSGPGHSDTPEQSNSPTSPGNHQKTVLVIDDDPGVRDVITRVLIGEGIRPVTSSDGMEGVDLARRLHPDLIILDVMMPKVDGWSVLGMLKSDSNLAKIPVVMQTVRDERDLAFMLGAADFVVKPVDQARLASLVRRYVTDSAETVLVVEDDEATREGLVRIVKKQGFDVLTGENGLDALKILQRTEKEGASLPKVILLDLMMPIMDGFEFLEHLQDNNNWNSIPVIVLTAKQLSGDETELLNGSVERVLVKGACNRERLLNEIKRVVGSLNG